FVCLFQCGTHVVATHCSRSALSLFLFLSLFLSLSSSPLFLSLSSSLCPPLFVFLSLHSSAHPPTRLHTHTHTQKDPPCTHIYLHTQPCTHKHISKPTQCIVDFPAVGFFPSQFFSLVLEVCQ